ncbi:MAG: hypothetical protein ACR5KW_04560 [Wolbachia sp.]
MLQANVDIKSIQQLLSHSILKLPKFTLI